MTHPARTALTGLLAVLCVLGAVSPALAQLTGERVERELERTDELLMRAREIVTRALGDRPPEILEAALALQREARDAFRDERYKIAAAKTRLAREMAARAVELAKAQLRLLEQVRHLIARNHELSARAREIVHASGNAEAARILEAGLAQLARGTRAFHDHEFRVAVRLSLFGRDLVLRAIRTAQGDRGIDERRVSEELARTEEFLREAEGVSDRRSRARFEEAGRLQDRARRELTGGNLPGARRLTLRARELVLDVLRAASEVPDEHAVSAHLDRVESRYRKLAEIVRGDRAADTEIRLLAGARDHLDEARAAAARGEHRRALAEAQLASSLLDQIELR